MGNLQSVGNLLEYLGEEYVITNNKEEIISAEKLILPGVGAFGEAMNNLKEFGLVEVIKDEVIKNKKPFLGICLGMQVLAEKGYEGGEFEGLGLLGGEVKLFDLQDKSLPIPHVGWNTVKPESNSKLYKDEKERVFYFVHSYHFVCENNSDVSGICDYGGEFVASIEKDNIFATQFHPEKSQDDGIEVFQNFLSYNR
jgi:glutamine amidotransferase